jgi:hypothetical protein
VAHVVVVVDDDYVYGSDNDDDGVACGSAKALMYAIASNQLFKTCMNVCFV